MTRPVGRALLLGPGAMLFVLVVVFPAVGLVSRSITLGSTDAQSIWPTARQWGLFGRSLWLAAWATVVGVLLSLPAAYVVGRLGRLIRSPTPGVILLAPLLLPPMVQVFGWQRLWFGGTGDELLCVWVWASWLWPIPAMLIGTAWARWGRCAYEAAILDAPPQRAFGQVVLPLLVRQAGMGALILLALYLTEYSVPHACGLIVLATELLGRATMSARPADVLVPAWPLVAAAVLALSVFYTAWRRRGAEEGEIAADPAAGTRSWPLVAVMLAVVGLTVGLPVVLLVSRLPSWGTMGAALRTYPTELWTSVGVAMAAGVAAVWMGLSVVAERRLRPVVVVAVLIFGVLPGGLVGMAVLAAYQPVELVYNHWPLLAIGYVARYGWIGVLVAWLASASVGGEVVAQARTDGASEMEITLGLRYRPNIALLLCGVGVVTAMSLADVALGSLLTVPGIGPVSGKLMEKFHRFEDGMLVSLSLWLVAGALPAAALGWVVLRLRRGEVGG